MMWSWEKHTMDLTEQNTVAAESGAFTAEIDGETYQVTASTLDILNKRLNYGASERQIPKEAPEDYAKRLVLYMDDECTVLLYIMDADGNDTVMEMVVKNWRYCFRLNQYCVYKWMQNDILVDSEVAE